MNWHSIVINFLMAIHIIVSLLIILLVLMQRPKNEGLGAAFGGGMTENLFGAQTTNVLQTVTRYLGGMFFALTLLLSWLYVQKSTGSSGSLQRRLSAPTTIPAAPATPAPGEQVPLPGVGPEAATPPVKPVPATPAPAPEAGAPVPVPVPEGAATVPGAVPAPAPAPEAAKPAPAPAPPVEKPADKPAEAAPAAPPTPAN